MATSPTVIGFANPLAVAKRVVHNITARILWACDERDEGHARLVPAVSLPGILRAVFFGVLTPSPGGIDFSVFVFSCVCVETATPVVGA